MSEPDIRPGAVTYLAEELALLKRLEIQVRDVFWDWHGVEYCPCHSCRIHSLLSEIDAYRNRGVK